jgi:PTS system cellobiose-specific IIC component
MIKPIREPLLLGAITVNMSAFEQGKEVPNIITMPFWDVYMSIGGSGLTIGLLIAVIGASMGPLTGFAMNPAREAVDRPGAVQY